MRNSKAQNEKTGEIRNIVVLENGEKHFDLGCASVKIHDQNQWIEVPTITAKDIFWLSILIANIIVWSMVYDK